MPTARTHAGHGHPKGQHHPNYPNPAHPHAQQQLQQQQQQQQQQHDSHSVILVTAGYDHVIRFWCVRRGLSNNKTSCELDASKTIYD
jgi:G protein beta subunit-like protein